MNMAMMSRQEALDLALRTEALIKKARRIRGIVDMGEVDWDHIVAFGILECREPSVPSKYIVIKIGPAAPCCKLAERLQRQLALPHVLVRAEW